MNQVEKTPEFQKWYSKLDKSIKIRIDATIAKIELGNLGDHKPLDELTYEIRIHIPSGTRLYYMWQGKQLILLLGGGNKASQEKDIKQAKSLAREIAEGYKEWTQ